MYGDKKLDRLYKEQYDYHIQCGKDKKEAEILARQAVNRSKTDLSDLRGGDCSMYGSDYS